MRISNNIMAVNTHRQYLKNTAVVSKSTEKLSSGYRVNRAGDDAAGLAISEKMRAQIRGLTMASKNSSDAVSLIKTAEGALQESHSILQRMRELAVQSSSDTNEQTIDRSALDAEFQQLKLEIDDTADKTIFNNMKLINGDYQRSFYAATPSGNATAMFYSGVSERHTTIQLKFIAGSESHPAHAEITYDNETKKVYAGDTSVRFENMLLEFDPLQIDAGLLPLAAYQNGTGYSEQDIKNAAGNLFLFQVELHQAFIDESYTPPSGVQVPPSLLTGLQNAANNAFVQRRTDLSEQARQQRIQATWPGFYTAAHAIEENSVRTAAEQAAQASFDWTTAYDDAAAAFDYTSAYNDAAAGFNHVQAYNDAYTAFDYQPAYDGYFAAYDPGIHLGYLDADDYATIHAENDRLSFATSTADAAQHTHATNIADAAQDTYATGIATAQKSAYITDQGNAAVLAAANAIAAAATNTADIQAAAQGQIAYDDTWDNAGTISAAESYATSRANAYLDANQGQLLSGVPKDATGTLDFALTDGKGLIIQTGANEGDEMGINIDKMDAQYLGIKDESIATREDASAAITNVNYAINKVSRQRASLGAMENRLNHKISNLDISAENLQAAESRIRDLDMAKEMTEMTKSNILVQASTAMLAQANASPQNVLSLLS